MKYSLEIPACIRMEKEVLSSPCARSDSSEKSNSLLFRDRNRPPRRRFAIESLEVLNIRNILGSLIDDSNDKFIPNLSFASKKINPVFGNTSTSLLFPQNTTNSFEALNAIDISKIATSRYPLGERNLKQQLMALFDALTTNLCFETEYFEVSLNCSYTYNMHGTSFPVNNPILFIPRIMVQSENHGQDVADMLATGLYSWLGDTGTLDKDGRFTMMLTVHSASEPATPILKLSLFLPMDRIKR
jgi:hypothetical protein